LIVELPPIVVELPGFQAAEGGLKVLDKSSGLSGIQSKKYLLRNS
jgi:hypothetical protein